MADTSGWMLMLSLALRYSAHNSRDGAVKPYHEQLEAETIPQVQYLFGYNVSPCVCRLISFHLNCALNGARTASYC